MQIKDSPQCSFCDNEDNIIHFFYKCGDVTSFWDTLNRWFWDINHDYSDKFDIDEHRVIFGCTGTGDVIHVLDRCILIAKFYIYKQRINNINNLNIISFKSHLKYNLTIEQKVSEKTPNRSFNKFHRVYNSL